jgi:nucleoside-diphosphate-sugar epimerase
MLNLEQKRVMVTGANSMIGRATIKALLQRKATVLPVYHGTCDLMINNQVDVTFHELKPDYVIHLAGYNGNILFNKQYPADIFYRTTVMGLNVLNCAAKYKVDKVVTALASCAYKDTDEILKVENFNDGMPNRTVEAHGLSKKALYHFSRQLNKQHGLNAVCTIFNTAYGPYDSFSVEKTKVVGGLITRFVAAVENGVNRVACWGTGHPRREFIYCDDAAEGLVQTLEKYDNVELPINLGFNEDISIRELAEMIAELTGFEGEILWDTEKPDGQYRKLLDSSKMAEYDIVIENKTTLEEGLKRTIEWYKKNR